MKQLWKNFDRRMGHRTVELLVKIWPFSKRKERDLDEELQQARRADAEFAKWFVETTSREQLDKKALIARLNQELKKRRESES